jgi:hypothetical protein
MTIAALIKLLAKVFSTSLLVIIPLLYHEKFIVHIFFIFFVSISDFKTLIEYNKQQFICFVDLFCSEEWEFNDIWRRKSPLGVFWFNDSHCDFVNVVFSHFSSNFTLDNQQLPLSPRQDIITPFECGCFTPLYPCSSFFTNSTFLCFVLTFLDTEELSKIFRRFCWLWCALTFNLVTSFSFVFYRSFGYIRSISSRLYNSHTWRVCFSQFHIFLLQIHAWFLWIIGVL